MRLCFAVIFFCIVLKTASQTGNSSSLRFQHFTEKDGLSNNIVHTIFKDSRGFMWIGTNGGLNIFDGSSFTVYRHSAIDTFSVAGNTVIDIAEDDAQQLWISSLCTGLSVLNPFNKKAVSYNTVTGNSISIDPCDIRLQKDDKKQLWLCNRTSLFMFQSSKKMFHQYPLFSSGENNRVYNFTVRKNKIWIGVANGLREFDIDSKKLSTHDDWTEKNLCSVIRADQKGNLLLGTWQKGLFIVDPNTGKKKELLNGNIVNDIAEISFNEHHQLWVATNDGLYVAELSKSIFELADESFIKYINDKNEAASLSSNEVKCISRNDNGTVWLGTANGIDIFDPSYLQFSVLNILLDKHPFSTTELNYALAEKDNNGNTLYDLCYWHGTGLLQTDSAFNIKNHLTIRTKENASVIISSCIRANDGCLWLATWNGLLCYDDRNKKILKTYQKETSGKLHLNTNKTDFVLQDKKGRFWIGTYGFGVNMLDIKNDTSYVFTANGRKGSLLQNRSDFIFEDSKGNIWITNSSALQKFNETTNDFTTYTSQKGDATSLPGGVNSIIEDHDHHLWLATDAGVSLFNESTQTFHIYTTKDGLAGDECNNLIEDKQGNIWIVTSGGLSSININSRVITSYTTNDGLPTNQLGSVIINGINNNILFTVDGGNSPFISFNATAQRSNKEIPLHFTSLSILGKEALFDKPLETLDALRLSYKQNVFTISFKALDYVNANNIRYQCKLEGFDEDWIDLDHRNNVTYTNLDGGNYMLLVKATNAKGEWLNKQLSLKIIVTPPFWKTWWFYALCVMLLIVIVYVVFRMRLNMIRREGEQKAAIAKEIAELEMKALKAQMNPHFIFNALSSIQESIVSGNTEAASKYLGKFSKLIRTVLEFSDKKLVTLQQEINYLTLYLELESFRFDDFHFNITASENFDKEFIRIPPMLVQPFIENSVKHGLNHKSGEKNLSVIFDEQEDGFLKVTIDDNGIGREHAAELNLARNLSNQSMGIKITSRRLQLMQQKGSPFMNVTDKTNNGEASGTQITILIPIETTA